jgi:4-carboxymuconolactone decarboxylase
MLSASQEATFRRLSIGDDALLASLFSNAEAAPDALDERTASLARIGALVMDDAEPPAYLREVRHGLDAGATPGEITAVLFAVASVAGSARVMAAAPRLALALGYDVEWALEEADEAVPG